MIGILKSAADFLFPRVCHICGTSLAVTERYVCTGCLSRMPRTLFHRVPDNSMEQRFIGKFPFRRATALFFYSRNSDLSVLMQDLKYRKFRGLARYLGEVAGDELLTTGFLSDVDGILPVPMHFWKKARRGYNQTEEIAAGLSKTTGVPVLDNLVAIRAHKTQTRMTLDQRLRNTKGIFRVERPGELAGKHLLILDDVCTTGSTLTSVADTILSAEPAAEVSMLTLGATF